jgi:hypothetical protein
MKFEDYLEKLDEDVVETKNYRLDVSLDSYSGCRVYVSQIEHKSEVIDAFEIYLNSIGSIKDQDKQKELSTKFIATSKKWSETILEQKKKNLERELGRILDTVSVLIKGKVAENSLWLKHEFEKMVAQIIKENK